MSTLIRALLIVVVVVVVVAAAAAFFLGYHVGDRHAAQPATVGTSGHVDTTTARERGAEIGEKVGRLANEAQDAISDGAITAKIKSKMALDDTIKSRDIHVSTSNGAVTLSGKVASAAERDRAMQLARETDGVKSVTDQMQIAK
jgi:hypothetical protein